MHLAKAITPRLQDISTVPVVKNFRRVIEQRDLSLMNKELYQFLNLYCGFIAHYNIHGFRDVYSQPNDFANVFIRHFDRAHRYFNGIYVCHEEPYKDTGFTKARIKEDFFRIVDRHKDAIEQWALQHGKDRRYAAYLALRKEFGRESGGTAIACDACGNEYTLSVLKDGEEVNDFGSICCPFCGHQIKQY